MTGTDVVDRVRERSDIVEIVGQHVQLRKTGRSFKGLCPFHQEKTPSFVVFPDSQNFHCFGCGAGGDVFNFVMQIERVDFREALRELAQRAGVVVEEQATPLPEQVERHARLFELNARAATFYTHVLWSTPNGEPGRQLLERRGVDRATSERFQLGFAPDRWDALLTVLGKHGVAPADLIEAGLATARENGDGAYDRLRNRLIFPIRDRDGRIVGFGGRALGDAQPKYLNSPQTAIFDKGANLYALDLAHEAIRRLREVVVVEGYMDAIAAHQFGFTNVVASMGTALTEAQVRLVRRSVDRIVLALDADAAGQLATVRGLDVVRASLGEADRLDVNPVGLVRFERTLKTDIRIVRLSSGKDPDELIRSDPDAWREAVAAPLPLLDFYVDAVAGDAPPADPREKSERLGRLVPLLREIVDPVVREHYVKLVARRLDVDEGVVRRARPTANLRRPRPEEIAPRFRLPGGPEEHLFALLVSYPELLAPLVASFPEQDVLDGRNRELLDLLRRTPPDGMASALQRVPDEVGAHLAALRATMSDRPAGYPGQVRHEAEEALLRLRKERHDLRRRLLMAEMVAARAEGDVDAVRQSGELLRDLMAHYPEFYPEPSPYFRDVRDAGGL